MINRLKQQDFERNCKLAVTKPSQLNSNHNPIMAANIDNIHEIKKSVNNSQV